MKPAASRLLHALAIAVFATMVLLAPWSASAQEARGTISGKVRDASDAVMPGVSVRITDVARGTAVTATTNDVGLYQAPYLLSGTYQITVEVSGFKKYVRGGIVLRIGDTLDIPIQLEIGQTSDTITVTAETPTLDTTSASMGQTVDNRRVAELPLVHGDPYTLIGLSTGVSFGRDQRLDRPFEPTHIVGFTFDGTRANRSDLTIDGAPSTATANANEVIATYVPPTDLIQEFKVQTATFDAQFGNTEGGVTSISIKSGTNALHGTGYFFGEPGSLAANDFFGNRAGQPRPSSFSNRYGGSLGGPVYIPKLYNGKNKTFFFWGAERIADARPRNNGTFNIPTQAMKNGDFSALLALGPAYQIYNPFSRIRQGSAFREDPFKCDSGGNPIKLEANNTQIGGTPCNIIPTQLINPVSKALLQFFPNPTTPGSASADGRNNFLQPGLQERASYYTSTIRVDHNISEKNRIFGRASWYDRDSTYNNYFNNLSTGTLFQFISRQGTLDDVYTFNSTTVLNVRYGYNRFIRVDGNNPANRGFDLTSVGFPSSYNNAIPADRRAFPRIDFLQQGTTTNVYQGTGFNNEPRPIDNHSVAATLNKTVGAHALKGGAEYRIYRENAITLINDVTGRFIFDSSFTRGPSSSDPISPGGIGQSFAAFLLGIPGPSSYVRRPADYAEESTTYGFFIHDDWRFNSRLTLNLGLRYEFETPLKERYNRSVSGFDFNFLQPIEAQAQAKYANDPKARTPEVSQLLVRGGLTFPGVNGQSEGLYETPKHNFMPRLGLAFRLNDKTVVRAGYGVFFGFLGQRRGDVVQSGFSQDTNIVPTVGGDGVTFLFPNGQTVFSNPFPNGIQEPVGAAQGSQTFLGQSITFFNPNPDSPYNQRWELGFQRELAGGWFAEASYVGNRGTHIEISRDLNVTPQKYLSKSLARDDATRIYLTTPLNNPLFGLIPNIGASTTINRENLLRPFPQFGTVTTTNNQGYSWYHSLQTRIEKRLSKGYTFQASYTYSKFMQATELLNQDDPLPTEVISDSDYPHRFAASGIYELPFGKGQRFLASTNGIVTRLVGGWQFQGVYTFQSGAPIQFGNVFFNGNLRDIRLPGDQQTPEHWFNTAGFVTASAQQPDHNVRMFPLRFGFVRYPRQNNFDLSFVKNTSITETTNVQFRAEFINAFNRVWLASPNTSPNGLATAPTSATFGQINSSNAANYARRVQLGLKLVF